MQIRVENPEFQTLIFTGLFIFALVLSIRAKKTSDFFPPSLTEQLKGFAILTIVFSHIGYFLSQDTKFLYPLSILAGVGVNLFLFLSGFGLTLSFIKHYVNPLEFYRKRLIKLFLPLWVVLTILVILDHFVLGINYSIQTIIQSFAGYFPEADILTDLNSPLWYFTLILYFYLLFPLFFWKRFLYLAPIALTIFSILLLDQKLPIDEDVINLYKLHILSFPLGMLFAIVTRKISSVDYKLGLGLIPLLIILFAYTALNSGVGEGKKIEQTISLITMFSVIFIFLFKPINFKLLSLFGLFSYEIYLFHWPLLLRYDVFYKFLPASLATALYLVLFLLLGLSLQKVVDRVTNLPKKLINKQKI